MQVVDAGGCCYNGNHGIYATYKSYVRQNKYLEDKLALLWGEAQKKIAYSYLKVA